MNATRIAVAACLLVGMFALLWPAPAPPAPAGAATVKADDVRPAGDLDELAIDDGTAGCALGPPGELKGQPGFGWANKLTPAAYPATLRSVTIGFNRQGPLIDPDREFRVVIYLDPQGDGPSDNQQPEASFIGRVRGTEFFMTFNLITPVTINEGSFVVGVVDETGHSDVPALLDVPGASETPGSESFITFNGGARWSELTSFNNDGEGCGVHGSFLIRASVETAPAEALSVVARIEDPQAVEPWDVQVGSSRVIVTNLVSDNLTIINPADNSFVNVPVGDGPGGTPDGPFGSLIFSPTGTTYVTLFGTNTLPSKEFPIDYAEVGPGRVAVLAGPEFTQAATINVGKGPMFPALVPLNGGKLYVPCAGDDRVDVISVATNQKIAEIPVGSQPSSCTTSIDGRKIYVTNFGDGTVSVIDPRTDRKIKDLQVPATAPEGKTPPPQLTNPWRGAISAANGNLYVTYWGAADGAAPNGGIAEFDTCNDVFVRVLIDAATGTAAGASGATGLPAPEAALERDPETGETPQAGGGGGGPFGIAVGPAQVTGLPSATGDPSIVFTNDALGLVGVIDSRIDQLVSAPALQLAACPKPRGIGRLFAPPSVPPPPGVVISSSSLVYVACGQPDSSVLVVRVPGLRENITDIPVIESFARESGKLRVRGTGLSRFTRLEFVDLDTLACLSYQRQPRVKKNGAVLLYKGPLSDGSNLREFANQSLAFRVINRDGTARLLINRAAAPGAP